MRTAAERKRVCDVITTVSEEDVPSGVSGARAYFNWQMKPLPPPPARPPEVATATRSREYLRVQLRGVTGDTEGVEIDDTAFDGELSFIRAVPIDPLAVVLNYIDSTSLEVRAFNARGISD